MVNKITRHNAPLITRLPPYRYIICERPILQCFLLYIRFVCIKKFEIEIKGDRYDQRMMMI